jgi:U32 family peptidase
MNHSISKIELLAPAGNKTALLTALENGADSVYFGVKGLNMRANAGNFEISELTSVMDTIRRAGKKGYLALNTVLTDHDLKKAAMIMRAAKSAGVDAVILWDFGALALAGEIGIPFHVSTQASVSNVAAVRLFANLGAQRVVLARECSLARIQEIVRETRANGIPCDIEVFGHGAMCVSVSGRCFLSLDAFGRSANQGDCLQPCRREYMIKDQDGDTEFILGKDYVLSPKDLWTLPFLEEVIQSGAVAIKIEGRMRPPEYVRVVVGAYRQAIDAYYAGTLTDDLKQDLQRQLGMVYNRGFSSGYYFPDVGAALSRKLENTRRKRYIGEVRKFYPRLGVIDVRLAHGEIRLGDQVLVMGKNTPARDAVVEEMRIERQSVERAGKGQCVGIKLPFPARMSDKIFLWEEKSG